MCILENDLFPPLGCTEPETVAYASVEVVTVLRGFPSHLNAKCKENIIKNVKGVVALISAVSEE